MPPQPTPNEEEVARLDEIMNAIDVAGWEAMMSVRKRKTGEAFYEPGAKGSDGVVRRVPTLAAARALGAP